MATSLYARAAARGFPVFDASGQTGQGALQDATALPPAAGLPTAPWADPNTDPASIPATLPPPQDYSLEGLGQPLWGLPGSANPDNTPRTHAAPIADPALLAAGLGDDLHGPVFTGQALRNPGSGHSETGTLASMAQGRAGGQGSRADTLQPLQGQIRSMGGLDAVQGYGGGGPGPGGVNDPQGPVTDDMTFGGNTYHNVFLNAAEVPFLVAEPDQFIASAPELPGYAPTYDAPTATVLAQAPIAADTPAQGPALAPAASYAGLPWG